MATAGNIRYNIVNCGVYEKGNTIILMYEVPDPKGRIEWDWIHQLSESGSTTHVAHMIGWDSGQGDRSRPIPDEIYKKLGSPKKFRDGIYFKVQMSRKDNVSIEEYFNQS